MMRAQEVKDELDTGPWTSATIRERLRDRVKQVYGESTSLSHWLLEAASEKIARDHQEGDA